MPAEHVDVLMAKRRQPGHVLVTYIEPLGAELGERGGHVDRVPKDDRVDDVDIPLALLVLPCEGPQISLQERRHVSQVWPQCRGSGYHPLFWLSPPLLRTFPRQSAL